MKKYFIYFTAIVTIVSMLFTTSCQRVENPSAIGVESEVTFSVSTPDIQTRAYSDGTTANKLTVAVYNGNSLLFTEDAEMQGTHANVTLTLVNGMNYNIVFWAQAAGAPYTFSPTDRTMTVNYNGVHANDENLDAFWKKIEYKSEGAKTQKVELTRPFAQLNIAANDWDEALNLSKVEVKQSKVKVEKVYSKMDMFTGDVADEVAVEFGMNTTPNSVGEKLSGYTEGYHWLAMNYLLVDEQELVVVTFNTDCPSYVSEKVYRDIPVKRNYRTNIYGKILTSDTEFDVETKPGFDGDEDIQHIATGLYLNENGEYVITEAAGLRFVANMANEGVGTKATNAFKDMFNGKTIILSYDIDLAGEEWTPMNLDGCTSLTIDGAGHKISNMVIKGEGYLGFISKCTGDININNLKFENPIVEGTAKYIGVVIGYQYGLATLNDVDVHGGVVSTNIANKGKRIGGLIGFSAKDSRGFNLKDCDVSETEIRGYHNVSGLVGTALANGKSFMSNCSVTKCKFYYSGDYETPDAEKNCGYHVYDSDEYKEGCSEKTNCKQSENQAFYVKISSEDAEYGESDKVVYVNNPENLQKVLLNQHTHTIMLGAGEFIADIYSQTKERESLTIIGSEGTKVSFANQQVRMELFTNFKIENCEIMHMATKSWGHIVFSSSKNANGVYTIENCTFNGVGTQGIYINETASGATYNILNCTFNGDFGSEGAITIQTNKDVNHTINIKGCEFNDIPETSHRIFLAKNGEGSYYYGWTLNTDLKASSSAEIVDFINIGVESINLSAGNYDMPTGFGMGVNLQGKNLTIKGTKETVIDVSEVDERDQFVTGANLAFEGVTLNFGTKNYMGFANYASLTYKNCTINGLQFAYGAGQTVFENCDLNSNGAEHSLWTWGGQNISFTNCDFTYGDRAVNCYGEGVTTNISFTNCNFTKVAGKTTTGAIETNSSTLTALYLTINNCTVNEGDLWWISTWDSKDGANTFATVDGKIATSAAISAAIKNGATTINLLKGEYIIPSDAQGKTLTFVGLEDNPEAVKVGVTKVGTGGENCDYGLDGSTVTFENITITTNSSTYIGYARCKGTYKNCVINGTYTLYDNSIFENCTFNVSGDVYNIWTWGAPTATFTECTFNSDGKAMLLYGTANTELTVNNCTFNDKGGLTDKKAAIEIGNDYDKSYELIVNNTTVNGYEINDKGISTGTTLWANKNSMGTDKLNVVVDGIDVY